MPPRQRALAGALDGDAVGGGIAEGHAQLDDVGAGFSRGHGHLDGGLGVGIARAEVGHQRCATLRARSPNTAS